MTRILPLLLFASTCFGQLTTQSMQPFFNGASSSSRWAPTNSVNPVMLWAELTPINGTWGPDTTTAPAADNTAVKLWTNYAGLSGHKWTKASAGFPTNYVSGGGGNGTSPRIQFTATSQSTLTAGVIPNSTNMFTWIVVAKCTASTGTDWLLNCSACGPPFLRYNASGLQISQGTTLSSPTTLVASQWYVITAVFASGASSHIDTNGVAMVTGTAGTGVTGGSFTPDIGSFGTANWFRGDVSRVWGWYGVLGSTELANAVAQCKTDFGIQ